MANYSLRNMMMGMMMCMGSMCMFDDAKIQCSPRFISD